MRLTITINCDNAAFCEDDREDVPEGHVTGAMRAECARILKRVAQGFENDDDVCPAKDDDQFLFDINGNKVGRAEFRP